MSNDTKLTRVRIEIVGEDADACRKLLANLRDLIEIATLPGYYVSKGYGYAKCDVDEVDGKGE